MPLSKLDPATSSPLPSRHGLMERLKRETRAEHAQVEALVGLMRPDVTLADYGHYLAQMMGYVAPVESALGGVPGLAAALPDVAERAKVGLLREDLTALGHNDCAFCEVPFLPAITAEALGVLYVLEGSTLGGQVMMRHFTASFGTADWPRAFLASYGPAVGPMWRAFGNAASEYAARSGEEEAIVVAARETFSALASWLARATCR